MYKKTIIEQAVQNMVKQIDSMSEIQLQVVDHHALIAKEALRLCKEKNEKIFDNLWVKHPATESHKGHNGAILEIKKNLNEFWKQEGIKDEQINQKNQR